MRARTVGCRQRTFAWFEFPTNSLFLCVSFLPMFSRWSNHCVVCFFIWFVCRKYKITRIAVSIHKLNVRIKCDMCVVRTVIATVHPKYFCLENDGASMVFILSVILARYVRFFFSLLLLLFLLFIFFSEKKKYFSFWSLFILRSFHTYFCFY